MVRAGTNGQARLHAWKGCRLCWGCSRTGAKVATKDRKPSCFWQGKLRCVKVLLPSLSKRFGSKFSAKPVSDVTSWFICLYLKGGSKQSCEICHQNLNCEDLCLWTCSWVNSLLSGEGWTHDVPIVKVMSISPLTLLWNLGFTNAMKKNPPSSSQALQEGWMHITWTIV